MTQHYVIAIDIGSSSIRASIVSSNLEINKTWTQQLLATSPAPNFIQYDGQSILDTSNSLIESALAEMPSASAIAITNQRATTALWNRLTGKLVGPVISWMDLRTAAMCLDLASKGFSIAPNQSATKLAFLLSLIESGRQGDYCFGTLETFLIWHLTKGESHLTDHTNAAMTGLVQDVDLQWNQSVLDTLSIPKEILPKIVPSCGYFGDALIRHGRTIPILGAIGDQQASLLGQGCTDTGDTKLTFGTGTILDQNAGLKAPTSTKRNRHGTFPIVAYSTEKGLTWGTEAIGLGSGSMINWLVQAKILSSPKNANEIDRNFRAHSSVFVVPANTGLGTPEWDFGARSVINGIDLSTTKNDIIAATLDGIAHIAADLIQATENDTNHAINTIQADGGMTANENFMSLVSDATGIPVVTSKTREATTIGAAALAFHQLTSLDYLDFKSRIKLPTVTYFPEVTRGSTQWELARRRWSAAKQLSLASIPELTNIQF